MATDDWTKVFNRKEFLDFLSKELMQILKNHEITQTLADGKNLFLLNTGKHSYKITIERAK